MSVNISQKLQWKLLRFAAQCGLVTKLAMALLLAALLLYLLVYRPQLANLQQLMAQQAAQKSNLNQPQTPPEHAVNAYLKAFPKVDERAAKINALMDLASQQHVLLDEVRYNVDAADNATPLFNSYHVVSPYHMEFSVFASYPEIHQFLSSVLTEMPYVALEQLDLSRENVEDEVVEAQIKLVFYFAGHNE